MNTPFLDERLSAAAAFVRQGARMADIGCDHGKLTVHMAVTKKASHVIAVDIRKDPLRKTKEQVEKAGIQAVVECRLGDGLSALSPEEADDIVMAGISGVTALRLLETSPSFWRLGKRFVFVPATKAYLLRKWLCLHGFSIIAETAACAADHVYAVICAEYTGNTGKKGPFFYALGLLADENTPQADAYRRKVLRELEKICRGRRQDPRYQTKEKEQLECLLQQIRQTV